MGGGSPLGFLRANLAKYHRFGAHALFFGSVDSLIGLAVFSSLGLNLAQIRAVMQLGEYYGRKGIALRFAYDKFPS